MARAYNAPSRSLGPRRSPSGAQKNATRIACTARRGDDDAARVQSGQPPHIGCQLSYRALASEHGKIVHRFQRLFRLAAQGRGKRGNGIGRDSRLGREIEYQPVSVSRYTKNAGTALETDRPWTLAQMFLYHPGGGQGRVAAKIRLACWREPANIELVIRRIGRNYVCGFRKVVLGGDLLQQIIRQPAIKRTDVT